MTSLVYWIYFPFFAISICSFYIVQNFVSFLNLRCFDPFKHYLCLMSFKNNFSDSVTNILVQYEMEDFIQRKMVKRNVCKFVLVEPPRNINEKYEKNTN